MRAGRREARFRMAWVTRFAIARSESSAFPAVHPRQSASWASCQSAIKTMPVPAIKFRARNPPEWSLREKWAAPLLSINHQAALPRKTPRTRRKEESGSEAVWLNPARMPMKASTVSGLVAVMAKAETKAIPGWWAGRSAVEAAGRERKVATPRPSMNKPPKS